MSAPRHGQCIPCPELARILLPAFEPCAEFAGACHGLARWEPQKGFSPHGFIGALGNLDDVKLVIVLAEPGDPGYGERYEGATAEERMEYACRFVYDGYERAPGPYEKNMRKVLNFCWPGEPLKKQLRKTWVTQSYLCSAKFPTAPVARESWAACGRNYLRPQLELLRDRVIAALGGKAKDRIGDLPGLVTARAIGRPGANRRDAPESWQRIGAALRARGF